MAGGRRNKAGRPPGSGAIRTREAAKKIAASGQITPLEVLAEILKDSYEDYKTARTRMEEISSGDDVAAMRELAVLVPFMEKSREVAIHSAQVAAPYLHPRLNSIEMTGKNGAPLTPPNIEITFVRPTGEKLTLGHEPSAPDPGSIRTITQSRPL